MDHANEINTSIRVELRSNSRKIEFLDTLVKIDDQRFVTTDLYTKPTDKHMYVNFKSDHPYSVKKAIPYGLGVRLKRICSKEEDYSSHRQQLKKKLRKRGYSSKFVENQLKKADQKDRRNLLHNVQRNGKRERMERVPLVLTYSSRLPDVHNIIRKNMPELHRSEDMKKVFKEIPIIAYRRGRNLGDTLVHGKTNRVMRGLNVSVERCQKKCVVCEMLVRGQQWGSGFPERVDQRQECRMWNVVYGINCVRCKKMVYVGETGRTLKQRLKEHEADVRLRRDKPIADHFCDVGHSQDDMGVCVLERIQDGSRWYRKIKEQGWIQKCGTEWPDGLNTRTKIDNLLNF